jgi:hypothetical protein
MSLPAAPAQAAGARSVSGLAFALIGAALFACKGIWIKLAHAEGIDSVTSLTWRMIVAVPIFLTIGVVTYRRDRARRIAAG